MIGKARQYFWRFSAAVILGLSLLLAYTWHSFPSMDQMYEGPQKTLVINRGESFGALAKRLEQEALIPSAFWFEMYARLHNLERSVKAGEYAIEHLNPAQLLDQLTLGKRIQHRLTIIEGSLFSDVIKALQQNPAVQKDVLNKPPSEWHTILGVAKQQLDGCLLPDTYFFERGTKDIDILLRAKLAADDYINTVWPNRSVAVTPFLKDQHQAVALASIVEKESVLDRERKKIAGVFFERLDRRMRLQSDPTVIYALGENYTGRLRKKDLRYKHPVNTYVNRGIPESAIGFPSRKSIAAVLHPELTGDLYFVAKGDGSHAFNQTLEQHNADVRKYILNKK